MISRLEAVNQILQAIGESEVSSLSSGLEDADAAEAVLDRVTREIQAKGWQCNTDYGTTLSRDDSATIPLPDNVLRVDTVGTDRCINVTSRAFQGGGHALYDIKRQRFTFDHELTCNIVWGFDFEDLTPELQMYIAAKAAREYQEAEMGSVTLDSFARRKEMETYAALLDAESEAEDSNALTQNPEMRRITYRRHYYWR